MGFYLHHRGQWSYKQSLYRIHILWLGFLVRVLQGLRFILKLNSTLWILLLLHSSLLQRHALPCHRETKQRLKKQDSEALGVDTDIVIDVDVDINIDVDMDTYTYR